MMTNNSIDVYRFTINRTKAFLSSIFSSLLWLLLLGFLLCLPLMPVIGNFYLSMSDIFFSGGVILVFIFLAWWSDSNSKCEFITIEKGNFLCGPSSLYANSNSIKRIDLNKNFSLKKQYICSFPFTTYVVSQETNKTYLSNMYFSNQKLYELVNKIKEIQKNSLSVS